MEKILYYELETLYGPLYIYEKYKDASRLNSEIPETREFFTHEEGIRGYDTLSFLTDSTFRTRERNMEGYITAEYMKPLTPSEFLVNVFPYLDREEQMKQKKQGVYIIFESQKNNKDSQISLDNIPIEEDKNLVANKILTKYINNKPIE